MYNVKRKDFGNGKVQYIVYSAPVVCTKSEQAILEEEISACKEMYENLTDERQKKQMIQRINTMTSALNEINEDKKLCNLSDEQYKTFLEQKEERKIKYRVGNDVRAKKKIFDYSRANRWEWFLTFTFSQEKVNRSDYDECKKKLTKWLNHMSQRYCDGKLKYLCVPELHRDGRNWHFHGLLSECGNIKFENSGHIDKKGRIIYNLPQFKFGFTTATAVTDTDKVSFYITKYITKSACIKLQRRQRYLASKNLEMPYEETYIAYNIQDYCNKLKEYSNVVWEQQKEYTVNGDKRQMYIFEIDEKESE